MQDLPFLEELESDNEVMFFTSHGRGFSKEKIKERLQERIEKQPQWEPFGVWVYDYKDTGDLVGWAMLLYTQKNFLELGYMIRKKYWGQGFATEVSQSLVDYAMTFSQVDELFAKVDSENKASIKVLEKVGFRFKSSKKEIQNERELDLLCYSFTRT